MPIIHIIASVKHFEMPIIHIPMPVIHLHMTIIHIPMSIIHIHCYRIYLTIQGWLGNSKIMATEWGWKLTDGVLTPVATDRCAAPDRVLRVVSCGCKVACRSRCKCRNAALFCTAMSSSCCRQSCENSAVISDNDSD